MAAPPAGFLDLAGAAVAAALADEEVAAALTRRTSVWILLSENIAAFWREGAIS